MEKIRYKYRKSKEGVMLDNVKCPVCGSSHQNFLKVVEHTSWAGNVKLLVECWSGNTYEEKPRHLYLIKLKELPIVEVDKVMARKKTPKPRRVTAEALRKKSYKHSSRKLEGKK